MDVSKEIQNEESNKGSLIHNWHCQELEHFITELIKKDRAEQLNLSGVSQQRELLFATLNLAEELPMGLTSKERYKIIDELIANNCG